MVDLPINLLSVLIDGHVALGLIHGLQGGNHPSESCRESYQQDRANGDLLKLDQQLITPA